MAAGIVAPSTEQSARDGAEVAGRVGLVARGLIYLVVAVLAAQLALGQRDGATDQRGALAEVAAKPFGTVLLVLLAGGFGCYALWRLARAVWGEDAEEPEAHKRLSDVGRAVVHLALMASTIRLLLGDPAQQDAGQTWSARLMAEGWGRWVVGGVGLAIAAGGVWLVLRGFNEKFLKHLERYHGWVVKLGIAGHIARGAIFVLIGGFVVRAAVRFDPAQPVGLDAALRELVAAPAGPILLLLVALGFAAFGAFSVAEARDRRVLE